MNRTVGSAGILDVEEGYLETNQQIQNQVEMDKEDRRLQHMLLAQQRKKRPHSELLEGDRVLPESKRQAIAQLPSSGQTYANYAPRFGAPRNEIGAQQIRGLKSVGHQLKHFVSKAQPDESVSTRRLRDASSTAAIHWHANVNDTTNIASLSEPIPHRDSASHSGVQIAQSPLKTIRLLRLSPSGYSLREFPYANCPEYVALSYTWGEESLTYPIFVNGTSIQVRINLALALSSVGQFDGDTYLWADAICINQKDDKEKSNLVQHMGDIFSNAKAVYAWLGPAEAVTSSSSTEDLFAHLFDLGSRFWAHAGSTPTRKFDENGLDLDLILAKNLDNLYRRFAESPGWDGGMSAFPIEAYASFSARPFWSRIWVLQEVFLAKELYYICGNCRLPSKQLAGALILLEIFQLHLLHSHGAGRERLEPNSPLARFAFESTWLPEMPRLIICTSIYPLDCMSLRIAMTNFCVKELPRGSTATDPRDMIFGLLGFANSVERSYVRADYSMSVEKTYAYVTHSMIRNGFTDILAWAQPETKRIAGLPSWVPDYTSTIYESLCSQGQAKIWLPQFRACGEVQFDEEDVQLSDSLTLSVRGRRLDKILWVGQRWFPRVQAAEGGGEVSFGRSASYKDILSFLEEIRTMVWHAETIHSQREETVRFTADAAWRVPCCDQVVVDSRLVYGDGSAQQRYEVTLAGLKACVEMPGTELPAESRPYVEALLHWADKRAFLTAGGLIGLGPTGAARGDTVTILDGFNACYVLKPESGIEGNEHSLVGEAYVDGIMDGDTTGFPVGDRELFQLL
ncbi:heterokaryon incompatibility protein-domain-containing protein [Nemania sp. FL0916]|nr:heterokaryon incompatibility protein-domain-containing protein [Nemania sp. FL0916]